MWFLSVLRLWREFTIGGLLIALLALAWWSDKNRDKVQELEYQLRESTTYVESLEDSLTLQNDMISDLATDKIKFEDISKATKAELERKKAFHKKEIEALLGSEIGTTCPEAMEWLVDKARGELRW